MDLGRWSLLTLSIDLPFLACCLDIDECASIPCDDNSMCTNTIGSFNCQCNMGFSGNGFYCDGTWHTLSFILID